MKAMFDNGGWLPVGLTQVINKTGRPEPVMTDAEYKEWFGNYFAKNFPDFGPGGLKSRGDDVSRREWRVLNGVTRKQLLHKGGKP